MIISEGCYSTLLKRMSNKDNLQIFEKNEIKQIDHIHFEVRSKLELILKTKKRASEN